MQASNEKGQKSMSSFDIVRAWKDAEYRQSLSTEEQALVPEHPAGAIELTDEELDRVGGAKTEIVFTAGCCFFTFDIYCITILTA